MLLIRCPYCDEERPEVEFAYVGEAHLTRPDAAGASDEEWSSYLYIRSNPRGRHREQWRHTHGCGRYFNAIRHTVSDSFVATYKMGAPTPDGDTGDVG